MDRRNAAAIILLYHENRKHRVRSCWSRKWLLRRDRLGAYKTLMAELELEDPPEFSLFLRITATQFEEILLLIGPSITKQETVMRAPLPAKE